MTFFRDLGPVLGKVKKLRDDKDAGALAGLFTGGQHILGVSNESVPHEEGDLMRSGEVTQDKDLGMVAISYDTDYARVQHEDEDLTHDAGRNAHFLSDALVTEREIVLALIQTGIRRKMGL